jgi:hypothetical protein
VEGLELDQAVGEDLAGWLGDLAARGDLTSSQLLYRLSCVCNPPEEAHSQTPTLMALCTLGPAVTLHSRVIPLLAVARQLAKLDPTSTPLQLPGLAATAHQQQQHQHLHQLQQSSRGAPTRLRGGRPARVQAQPLVSLLRSSGSDPHMPSS